MLESSPQNKDSRSLVGTHHVAVHVSAFGGYLETVLFSSASACAVWPANTKYEQRKWNRRSDFMSQPCRRRGLSLASKLRRVTNYIRRWPTQCNLERL